MRAFLEAIFARIIGFFIMMFFIFTVGSLFTLVECVFDASESNKTTTNTKKPDPILEKKTPNIIQRNVYWYDYNDTYFMARLKIDYDKYLSSVNRKENNYATTISSLYNVMYNHDKPNLDLIYNELLGFYKKYSLSRKEFANLIVSMVQGMPYSFVMQETCSLMYSTDYSVRRAMDNGVKCEGNVYAGVYSPLEFVYKKKGDCDSRTVFLYTLLKKFNYDVAILNSDVYAHSIIGVNLPSYGRNYKYINGKRYYTWETTNTGWGLGDMPAEFNDLKYWYLALSN